MSDDDFSDLSLALERGFFQDVVDGLNRTRPNQAQLAVKAGVHQSTISRLSKGASITLDNLAKILDALGAQIVFPDERQHQSRTLDVNILMESGQAMVDVKGDEYLALPVYDEMSVGLGQLAAPKRWSLVWKGLPCLKHTEHLHFVELSPSQTGMLPTLKPRDTILINAKDYYPQPHPGNIYLVKTPGSHPEILCRRAALVFDKLRNRDQITFYCDNPHIPPQVMLVSDYPGGLREAVIGRIIHACIDMTER